MLNTYRVEILVAGGWVTVATLVGENATEFVRLLLLGGQTLHTVQLVRVA